MASSVGRAIGSATLAVTNAVVPSVGGSIDVVIVIQPDGTYRCSPFHVRFGKYQGLLKRREKAVKISVNDVEVDVSMQLSHTGEAYFVGPDEEDESQVPADQADEDELAGARSPATGETSADEESARDNMEILEADDVEEEAEGLKSSWGWLRWRSKKSADVNKDICDEGKFIDRTVSDPLQSFTSPPSSQGVNEDSACLGVTFSSPPDGYLADYELPRQKICSSNSSAPKSPKYSVHGFSAKSAGNDVEDRAEAVLSSNEADVDGEDDTQPQAQLQPQQREMEEETTAAAVSTERPEAAESTELSTTAPPIELELSLCARLLGEAAGEEQERAIFQQHLVSRQRFLQDPEAILQSKHLMCSLNGSIRPWSETAKHLVGYLAYSAPLPLLTKPSLTAVLAAEMEAERASLPVEPPTEEIKATDLQVSTKTPKRVPFHRRMKIPTTEQLASLGLKRGRNVLKFTFYTSVWGTQEVLLYAYLWNWNAKVVISDVDGTITKSDMLGHILPMVGRDWSHSGIAQLFRNISDNGYEFIYLTSRAIAQANITRDYLSNLSQDGENMPEGPLLMSPDSIGTSLYREVIKKTPHEFKIHTLSTIKNLFPAEWSPFYAGFGNRNTDEMSYAAVGVPDGKIFTINPSSQVACVGNKYSKSYTLSTINTLVDQMFPPVKQESDNELRDQEVYNTWNFWKSAPSFADIDDEELENA